MAARRERVAVEYPIGHRRRRAEGMPLLMEKFERALRGRLSARQAEAVLALAADPARLDATPVASSWSCSRLR